MEELGLSTGSVRADMAVVNGILKGYEIKSQRDTLTRLKMQVTVYGQVFDTCTLVVAERHLKKATLLIPSWWGIEVASWDESSSAIELNSVRDEQLNSDVDGYTLVKLLWRDEVLSILRETGAAPALSSKPRAFLWKSLADSMPLSDLKAAVRLALKNRKGWRSDQPQTPDDGMFLPSAKSSSCQSRSVRQRSRKFSYRPN